MLPAITVAPCINNHNLSLHSTTDVPRAPRKSQGKSHNPRLVGRKQMRIPASRRPLFPSANYVAPEDLTPPHAPKVVRTQARRFRFDPRRTPVCRTLQFSDDEEIKPRDKRAATPVRMTFCLKCLFIILLTLYHVC